MSAKASSWLGPLLGLALCLVADLGAQEPPSDAELIQHLAAVKNQIETAGLNVPRREELALEMAATLDRAAQSSTNPDMRRRRWAQAIELLDWFLKQNPSPPRERQVRLLAGVLRWAQGQSWKETALLAPSDPKVREQSAAAFDDAIERFRSVADGGSVRALAENITFRLAEALADRADLEATDSAGRKSREAEALTLLEHSPAEPSLVGFWHLLKADLLRRGGKPTEAERDIEAATRSTPPPPPRELVAARVPLLLEQKKLTEALRCIESANLEPPVRGLWMVRLRLAQLAAALPERERTLVASELFRWIKELRGQIAPESRQAMLELARSRVEPEATQPAEAWEAIAEAYGLAGEPAKAGAAMVRAASRAAASGQVNAAAGYRVRGGAFFFQAGRFEEAERILASVVDDQAAGPIRAKAGMLRTLALGRAVALRQPGASSTLYAAALDRQIRDFPADPSTHEARFLRGQLALAADDGARARSLWSAIGPTSSRWLDAQLAVAELDRDELEVFELNPNRSRMVEKFGQGDRFLEKCIGQASSESDAADLLLARARLALTPLVGMPELARDLCDRVKRLPASAVQLYQARLYRMVAQVQIGRYVEAEREAQAHAAWRLATQVDVLLDAVRLVDECAVMADTDLRQRRFGLVQRLLVQPLLAAGEEFSDDNRRELAMRLTRARLFTGDDREARRSLAAWGGTPPAASDRLLRDLGDTYNRLELYSFDIDVQKLRQKNNAAGSPRWFDARYALALAYFRTGRIKEAAQLIDSTAILHPDLGGGTLHDKFIHLRQRLGIKPQ